jgi:hypothetical protein
MMWFPDEIEHLTALSSGLNGWFSRLVRRLRRAGR